MLVLALRLVRYCFLRFYNQINESLHVSASFLHEILCRRYSLDIDPHDPRDPRPMIYELWLLPIVCTTVAQTAVT